MTDLILIALRIEFNKTVPPVGNRLVSMNYSDTVPFRCHFNLASVQDQGKDGLNSPNFNIQIEANKSPVIWSNTTEAAATSSSALTSTPAVSATSKTSNVPETTMARASSSGAPFTSDNGLTTDAIVRIAVGTSGGVFVLLTLAVLLWLRSRKQRREVKQEQYDKTSMQIRVVHPTYAPSTRNDGPVETEGSNGDSEMVGSLVPIRELEGSNGASRVTGGATR